MRYSQYIPHDVNARFNEQVLNMIEMEGGAGYGLYWSILEYLRAQDNYTGDIRAINGLAKQLKIRKDKALRVLNDYGIFVINNLHFYSPALTEMMQPLEKKRAQMEASRNKSNTAVEEKPQNEPERQEPAEDVQENAADESENVDDMQENVVVVSESPCKSLEINGSSDKVKQNKEKEIKNKISSLSSSKEKEKKRYEDDDGDDDILSWDKYIDALQYEEEWKEQISRRSHMHKDFFLYFDQILQLFKEHLIMFGKEDSIQSVNDAKRYLCFFLTPDSITHTNVMEKVRYYKSIDPYRFEYRDSETNQRMYCGLPIPDDAPPRPSENACWNPTTLKWFY